MDTTQIIFSAIMPIFFVIGAGALARKVGWLNMEADRSLMAVVVNLLYPALIFSFILGNEALKKTSNLLLPPLVGFTTVVVGFAIAMLVARRFNIGDSRERRTFAFTTGLYNYGYFPIPIIALLFDRETTGVLLVHNVGVEVAMWGLGVGFILSANDPKPVWRRIFSAPVISILIAVPLNSLGFAQHVPHFATESFQLLGQCAIPLGLLLIGATFADLSSGVNHLERIRIPALATTLRIGIFPILFLLCAWSLPLSTELKQVIIVQAAMPCAVFPIVLARHYDGSPEVALKIVIATAIISFISIPLWISLGLQFVF